MNRTIAAAIIPIVKRCRTTIADDVAARPLDLVKRQFTATRPNQLWVADGRDAERGNASFSPRFAMPGPRSNRSSADAPFAKRIVQDAQPRVVSPVELRGDRLCLRPCREAYASALHRAVLESSLTLHPWMAWCHAGYEQRESEEWLRRCETQWSSGEAYEFALFDRADHYVGGAGLNDINRMYSFANLGYWIRRSRQGQALAVEAVRLLARFGFRTLGLTRIEIVAASDNVASRRVAEKAGARLECIARNRLIVADKPVPAAVYSLVPDDPL